MPSGRDWLDLIRATFHAVGRKDISGLYRREWRGAREKLTVDHSEELARKGGRIRRFFRTSNAILFGVSKRLSPARRVLFAAALLSLVFALQAPRFSRSVEKEHGRVHRTTEYSLYFDNFWLFVAVFALGSLLAMELVDKIIYRDELELARDLQASLIPRELPEIPPWEIAAYNRIANTVGGDIYDFVGLDSTGADTGTGADARLAVLFGDASGHGMRAGLIMAVAHAAFRTQLEVDPEPEPVFATLNRILCRTGGRRAFFGCVYFLLSPDGSLTGSVAGHPPVLRLSEAGEVLGRIGAGAYPLGIRTPLAWPVESARIEPGERLLLYSDGVSEARNPEGDEFGEERVIACARRAAGLPPASLVAMLSAEVRAFCGDVPPDDDVSVVAVARRDRKE